MIRFWNVFEQGGPMKRLYLMAAAVLAVAAFAGAAEAQKKPVRKASARTMTIVPPLEVRAAREKVQVQHDNVRFWIDKLGPIASALELLDQTYAKKRPSSAKLATHSNRKQYFVQTLRNLRDDLAAVESEFRTKAVLQKYLPNIKGITDLAAKSEDSALAGRFVAAKDPLRAISTKLTDTLAVLPR
jgi:hypothetical protein